VYTGQTDGMQAVKRSICVLNTDFDRDVALDENANSIFEGGDYY
jgi:hypothetical protein